MLRNRLERAMVMAILSMGAFELAVPGEPEAAAYSSLCFACVPLIMCPEQSEGDEYCISACGPDARMSGCNFGSPCTGGDHTIHCTN